MSPLNSLLATFGLTAIIEAGIQYVWTADFRKLESVYAGEKFRVGELFVPVPELLTLVLALLLGVRDLGGDALHGPGTRAARAGRGRADGGGLRHQPAARTRCCWRACAAALAGIAGVCLALSFTLTPSQIYAWVGVVFAAVMLGGLGSPLGPLAAGIVIGVSEAVTMAFASPSWAPIVSFSLLIALLLLRPGRT